MEQIVRNEIEYRKGFNNGYLIAAYSPELLKRIKLDTKKEPDYTSGFISGIGRFEIEKQTQQLKELQNLRSNDRGLGRELEK